MTFEAVGYKINGAIGVMSQNQVGNITLYTCPANSFAIINASGSGTGTITVGGRTVYARNDAGYDSYLDTDDIVGVSTSQLIYVGPGQSVVSNFTAAFVWSGSIAGVEFVNS